MEAPLKTLREIRESRGLSPVELAADLGVSLATIYNWETGRSEPRASVLRQLAEVLDVRMEEIYFQASEHPKTAA